MNILFDNPLANMRGEYFLLFYILVFVLTAVFLLIARYFLDQTGRNNLPQIDSNIDPLEVAYLRGGRNEATRSLIFSLLQKGFISVQTVGKVSQIKRIASQKSISSLPEIEREALESIRFSTDTKGLFNADGLAYRLDNYWNNYQAKLERQQFLATNDMKIRFTIFRTLGVIFLLLLAAYKVLAAIIHGHRNFMLPVLLSFFASALIAFFIKKPRLTKLGKSYLKRLKTAFGNLPTHQANSSDTGGYAPQATFGAVDPMLLSVGIFGTGILAGTAFNDYNEAFRKASNSSSGSCGSGCGSSCSSSDGGSGCSSGCGGGCGGCGGS